MHYEYDEEASQAWHMDVVHEVDDMPVSVERWQESNRRLNGIHDALARKILALHEKCGSGDGECDGGLEEPQWRRPGWPCETTELIASHFGVEYPAEDWDKASTPELR